MGDNGAAAAPAAAAAIQREVQFHGPPPEKAADNAISTTKYSFISFIPQNLLEQFRRIANLYFLVISVLMFIGTYYPKVFDSPLSPWSTLGPLIGVLAITMVKEGYEDSKRRMSDNEINNRKAKVLKEEGTFEDVAWKALRPGSVVLVRGSEPIPADMVLLQTSKPDGSCYIETSNIDGETDLKAKESVTELSRACPSRAHSDGSEPSEPAPAQLTGIAALKGAVTCQPPNNQLYKFEGRMDLEQAQGAAWAGTCGISYDGMLLRGCTLRNTQWIVGLVVYTGRETKVMMKSGVSKAKMSLVEKTLNASLQVIFGTQFVMCVITTILSMFFDPTRHLTASELWYLEPTSSQYLLPSWLANFFTFLILFNNFIPISLYVTVEMVNYCQAMLVDTDLAMYDPETDTPAKARTSNLNQDLGQVQYVFSDKTGTLTRNVMEFKVCSINGRVFGTLPDMSEAAEEAAEQQPPFTPGHPGRAGLRGSVNGDASPLAGKASGRAGSADDTPSRAPSGLRRIRVNKAEDSKKPAVPARKSNKFVDAGLSGLLGNESAQDSDTADAFVTCMAVCHTVVPEDVSARLAEDAGAATPSANDIPPAESIVFQAESPDEGALVQAAADLGYRLCKRATRRVTIAMEGRQAHARTAGGGSGAAAAAAAAAPASPVLHFELLGVHKFNSTRKRMSVVVRDPRDSRRDGAWLYCKGADNVMLDRAPRCTGREREVLEGNLIAFADTGLRTLVMGRRWMTGEEVQHWREAIARAEGAVGRKDEELAAVAEEVEVNLEIVGASAIEDRLQDGVPNTIHDLARAGIKTWVLTGDKVETAINIGRTCKLITEAMGEPLRVTGGEHAEVMAELAHASAVLDEAESRAATATAPARGGQRRGDPALCGGRGSGGGSGGRQSFGVSRRIEGRNGEQLRGRAQSDDLDANYVRQIRCDTSAGGCCSCCRGKGSSSSTAPPTLTKALVITGPALDHVIIRGKDPVTKRRRRPDRAAEALLLRVAQRCQAVIACRVSPAQKAEIVGLVRSSANPKPMTLAIGDGANDVDMIKRAQVGIGISGKEGMQAVNASDFAVAQFRFLKRLLLVHGRWSYVRMADTLLYSFYKNVVITVTLFLYNLYAGISGTSFYESMIYSLFNFVLGLPIIAVGVLDRDISARSLMAHPGAYVSGRENLHLTPGIMGSWVLLALVHGCIIYFLCYGTFADGNGTQWSAEVDGLDVAGFSTYLAMIWAMQAKVAMVTKSWTWVHVFVVAFSQVVFYLFCLAYSQLGAISPQFYGVAMRTFARPTHWLQVVLVTSSVFLFDFAVEALRLEFWPSDIDKARALSRGPDADKPWGDEPSARRAAGAAGGEEVPFHIPTVPGAEPAAAGPPPGSQARVNPLRTAAAGKANRV